MKTNKNKNKKTNKKKKRKGAEVNLLTRTRTSMETKKKNKWKIFFGNILIVLLLLSMLAALIIVALDLIPEKNSYDIKSKKGLKIFLLLSGVLCTASGFLVGLGVVPMKSGNLPLTIYSLLLMCAIVFFYRFFKLTRLPKNYLPIIMLIFIISWSLVNTRQWLNETNDSIHVKGGVRIAARITEISSALHYPSFTYEFRVNEDVFSRYKVMRLRNRKIGDTILIVYSVDNPNLNHLIDMYPSRKQIEKYRHGVYFEMKEKE